MILYRTTIHKTTDKVIGINKTANTKALNAFETVKDQAQKVTEVSTANTLFITDVTHAEFKAIVTDATQIKYEDTVDKYTLYYLS